MRCDRIGEELATVQRKMHSSGYMIFVVWSTARLAQCSQCFQCFQCSHSYRPKYQE